MFEKWLKRKPLTQGQQKERQARVWLEQHNIEIIAQNFHCRGGEIDLIGLSEHSKPIGPNHSAKQSRLIFFEVKYRKITCMVTLLSLSRHKNNSVYCSAHRPFYSNIPI